MPSTCPQPPPRQMTPGSGAGKTGLGLAQQEDALMDKQIKNTVELARMETKLAQTREQLAGEAGKTEESRLKRQELLNSIMSQMDAISRRRIDYAYEEWKLLEAQAKAASDTSDDTRLKIAQAQANYENEVARASEEVLRFKKQEATVDAQIAADIAKLESLVRVSELTKPRWPLSMSKSLPLSRSQRTILPSVLPHSAYCISSVEQIE